MNLLICMNCMLFDCQTFVYSKWTRPLHEKYVVPLMSVMYFSLKYLYPLHSSFVPRLADDFLIVSSTNPNVMGGTTVKSRVEFADAIVLSAMTAFLDTTLASFSVRYEYS